MGNITKEERARRAAEAEDAAPVAVEQGNAAFELDDAPAAEVSFTAPEAESITLDDYIRRQASAKLSGGVVLVSVAYPGAVERIYDATYSGVRVTSGRLGCTWSDGTTEGAE